MSSRTKSHTGTMVEDRLNVPSTFKCADQFGQKVDSSLKQLKVIVMGDVGTGKTSLIYRFAEDLFKDNYTATIGIDFVPYPVNVEHLNIGQPPLSNVSLQLWDTAGQERFASLASSFYRGAYAMITVFDASRQQTFSECQRWIQRFQDSVGTNIPCLLVANKCDLVKFYDSLDDLRQTAKLLGFYDLIEASAKTGYCVDSVFYSTTRQALYALDTRQLEALTTGNAYDYTQFWQQQKLENKSSCTC